ncbi:MAG: ribonuclease HI [Candidatus Microsaccharimonas sossegonensis]|uniref:ribonuclease H n=1 Tax=Candidatus Microsaccharimonas sossegonensis TaxID=2506948 RepID=A0A4Q0AHW2_9BACT|nr:MAG: ribonuclease HI [Candidatus Microsaccharimonas sossegonensis]
MITYYTDGSCSPNPGPGGFAVIKDMQPWVVGHELSSTNIRMEGMALIAAMRDAGGKKCQIYSDSEFWINVMTKWASDWEAKSWAKKGGAIKNLDLVKEAHELYQNSQAILTWVRGHEGDLGNEMADEWANIARTKRLHGPVNKV